MASPSHAAFTAFVLSTAVLRNALGLTGSAAEQAESVREDLSEGQKLQAMLEQCAGTLPHGATKDLLQSFRICGSCEDFWRFGETHDGGYLMCMDNLKDVAAAYSVGVEHHDRWSQDAHEELAIPVYQLDCTIQRPRRMCSECQFFQNCLAGPGRESPKPAWTLSETLKQTGQASAGPRSLLGKIDIEGSEWGALASADVSTLQKFRQLVVEFHHLNHKEQHPEYLKAMQRLQQAGFRVVHMHGNNYADMFVTGNYSIPSILEVTFDSEAEALHACAADETILPLDSDNVPQKAPLPPAHLPNF